MPDGGDGHLPAGRAGPGRRSTTLAEDGEQAYLAAVEAERDWHSREARRARRFHFWLRTAATAGGVGLAVVSGSVWAPWVGAGVALAGQVLDLGQYRERWTEGCVMTDEEAARFTEALQSGGTLCLPPGLYDEFIALPAGRMALALGIKVVKSEILPADEVVVLAPAPSLSELVPLPMFDHQAAGDGLPESLRSLPPFGAAFDDLLAKLLNDPTLYVGRPAETLAGNSAGNSTVISDAPGVLKGEGEER